METKKEELRIPRNLRVYFANLRDGPDEETSIVKLPGEWRESIWYWIMYTLARHDAKHGGNGKNGYIDASYVVSRVNPENPDDTFLIIRTLFRYGVELLLDAVIDVFMAYFFRNGFDTGHVAVVYKVAPSDLPYAMSYKAKIHTRWTRALAYLTDIARHYTHDNKVLIQRMVHFSYSHGEFFSSGINHAFYITSKGVCTTGLNFAGQRGAAGAHTVWSPTLLTGSEDVICVGCCGNSSGVLSVSGLYMTGSNLSRHLALHGNSLLFKAFERVQLEGVIGFSLGLSHCLILTRTGVYACGENTDGRLGLGDRINRSVPERLERLPGVVKRVYTGGEFSMIWTTEGLYAFGGNRYGELGVGDFVSRERPTRVILPGDVTIKAVVCGRYHAAILTTNGRVYVWGSNMVGQLGLRGYNIGLVLIDRIDGETIEMHEDRKIRASRITCRETPLELVDLSPVKFLSCGETMTLFGTTDGKLLACGRMTIADGTNQVVNISTQDDTHMYDTVNVIAPLQRVNTPSPLIGLTCSEHTIFMVCQAGLYGAGSNAGGKFMDAARGTFLGNPVKSPLWIGYEAIDLRDEDNNDRPTKVRRTGTTSSLCTMCDNEAVGREPFHQSFAFCGSACFSRFLAK